MRTSLRCTSALVLFASAAFSQELVLPVGGAWGGATYTVTGTSPWGSSTAVWSTTLSHRQFMYDAANFTNPASGVTGPVGITRLRFRAEDGSREIGGHTWSGVTITIAEAPPGITTATMSTTFASNIGVILASQVVNVTDLPASGSVPNDYTIDIPLNPSGPYDPTLGNSLVIDIDVPAPPSSTANIAGIATTNNSTTFLSRALNTTTAASATGTLSATCPIVLVDLIGGPGGKLVNIAANLASLGAGCGGNARSFYQYFDGGEPFDLDNTSLRLTPDSPAAPTNYCVTPGVVPVDLTKIGGVASTGDDSVVTHTMGWTFNYPGGTATNVRGCTNGYVWVGGTTTTGDFSVTVNELLGVGGSATTLTARFAPAWHDWHQGRNTTFNPLAGMYHFTDTTGGPGNNVTYVTWVDNGEFNSSTATTGVSLNSFQCVFFEATMEVEFRYGNIDSNSGIVVTGWSPGFQTVASVDPGSRDLSCEVPFCTNGPDGAPNMKLVQNGTGGPTAPGRAFLGNTISMTASNIPATDVIGFFFTDFTVTCPGVNFAPFLAPGCNYNLPGSSSLYPFALGTPFLPSPTVSAPLFIPPVKAFCGAVIYTQFVSWGTGFPIGGHVSNVVAARIGSN